MYVLSHHWVEDLDHLDGIDKTYTVVDRDLGHVSFFLLRSSLLPSVVVPAGLRLRQGRPRASAAAALALRHEGSGCCLGKS